MVPVTETTRLALVQFAPEDAAFILELLNEPGWLRFIGDRNVHSENDARAYIANGPARSYAEHGFGLWKVTLRESGEALGMCGLIQRPQLERVDVGFAFLERHWGRGYAREAVAATLALARGRYGLAGLAAITDPENHASQKVLTDSGFRYNRLLETKIGGQENLHYLLDFEPARKGSVR